MALFQVLEKQGCPRDVVLALPESGHRLSPMEIGFIFVNEWVGS